jgi:glutathione S-transferase
VPSGDCSPPDPPQPARAIAASVTARRVTGRAYASALMLRLYRFRYSTNVERVALALAHKGLEVESVAVDPADRSPLRELSGQDLVPVLVDGEAVVTDSTRIMHHLERRFPDPPLFPAGVAAQAEVEVFLDWFNRAWKREPNLIADAIERGAGEGEDVDRWSARLQRRLELFEGLLSGRDFLFGAFGAADCAAWPFLRYAVAIDPDDDEIFHRVLHERMTLDERHPSLRAWIARVGERPRA